MTRMAMMAEQRRKVAIPMVWTPSADGLAAAGGAAATRLGGRSGGDLDRGEGHGSELGLAAVGGEGDRRVRHTCILPPQLRIVKARSPVEDLLVGGHREGLPLAVALDSGVPVAGSLGVLGLAGRHAGGDPGEVAVVEGDRGPPVHAVSGEVLVDPEVGVDLGGVLVGGPVAVLEDGRAGVALGEVLRRRGREEGGDEGGEGEDRGHALILPPSTPSLSRPEPRAPRFLPRTSKYGLDTREPLRRGVLWRSVVHVRLELLVGEVDLGPAAHALPVERLARRHLLENHGPGAAVLHVAVAVLAGGGVLVALRPVRLLVLGDVALPVHLPVGGGVPTEDLAVLVADDGRVGGGEHHGHSSGSCPRRGRWVYSTTSRIRVHRSGSASSGSAPMPGTRRSPAR